MNGASNDIFNFQKVDGSTLYDALELSFNTVDKTSILKYILLIYYNQKQYSFNSWCL